MQSITDYKQATTGDTGITCLKCGYFNAPTASSCSTCQHTISKRKNNSLNRTAALTLAALICAIPANLLPIMTTSYLGNAENDTIFSGIVTLWNLKAYFVAIVVFLASFITPFFKIISLSYLTYTCKTHSKKNPYFRSKLFHFTEMVGRWSMIDVFVVALLSALVKMGFFADVTAGPGIIAFLLVVVLTMLAAESFDPRLIWDDIKDEK